MTNRENFKVIKHNLYCTQWEAGREWEEPNPNLTGIWQAMGET